MHSRFDFLIPFILIGIGLWSLSGTIVAMGAFETVYSIVKNSPPDLSKLALEHWGNAMFYTALTWGGLGGIFGLIIGLIFFSRPSHEHYTAAARVDMGEPSSGPKTLAELHTGFIAWFIGFIMVTIAAIVILPYFQTDLLIAAPTNTRVGFACVCGIGSVVPVLPFSLGWLRIKLRDSYKNYC